MFIAIVGPSGAGKDTLLDMARAELSGDARFRFVQRSITRPADAGGEAHRAVTPEVFHAEKLAGRYALWWEAHGLYYGIPDDVIADVAAGRVVIASLSRTVIPEARRRMPTRVVEITASDEVRASRLAARGRESAAGVTERVARKVTMPSGSGRTVIVNDRTREEGAQALLAILVEQAAMRQDGVPKEGAMP